MDMNRCDAVAVACRQARMCEDVEVRCVECPLQPVATWAVRMRKLGVLVERSENEQKHTKGLEVMCMLARVALA